MRVVRDRAEARWLPSRYRFAIVRLFAFLRLRAAKPRHVPGLMLMIDRDQSTLENYGIALWLTLTLAAFLSAELTRWMPLAAAIVVSIPLGVVIIQLPTYVVSPIVGLMWKANGRRINSVATMLLFIVAALHYAATPSWARFVAWHFLALVMMNALAAMLVFALRKPIAALEAKLTCAAA